MRRATRLDALEDHARPRVRSWLASLSDDDLDAVAVRWAGMTPEDVATMRARVAALSDAELLALAAPDGGTP
ncbi:hypothetical protein E7T09_12990 [Deinococcus sp. KSM4-11]|uniref:hypothetical protein n=1 Tax=Deinococcus sp. KSM4-11 TaxID=2568654 RepID=UPI0010A39640|nr:hypothetical protein [Deinococcus sp. KSM4-11]THF86140.1 hypothetical protein E7T09_12990 [Deinococcus sp. KSM4-11]